MLRKLTTFSGVYSIQQKGYRGKKLIATSKDLETAFRTAKLALQNGNYNNYRVQNDYRRNANFEFVVLYCEPHTLEYHSEKIRKIAQGYIEKYQTANEEYGYNRGNLCSHTIMERDTGERV